MNEFSQYIGLYQGDLHRISSSIHANPEIAFQEKKSSELLITYLERQGFTAERNFKEMETAFRITHDVCGGGKRVLFISEYDALPGLGHACGVDYITTNILE